MTRLTHHFYKCQFIVKCPLVLFKIINVCKKTIFPLFTINTISTCTKTYKYITDIFEYVRSVRIVFISLVHTLYDSMCVWRHIMVQDDKNALGIQRAKFTFTVLTRQSLPVVYIYSNKSPRRDGLVVNVFVSHASEFRIPIYRVIPIPKTSIKWNKLLPCMARCVRVGV